MLMTTFSETRAFTSMFQVEKGTWEFQNDQKNLL